MSEEPQETGIVPWQGGLLPKWWTEMFGPVPCVTSLNAKGNTQERYQLFNILNDESEPKEPHINTILELVHYCMVPASKPQEDGEVTEFVRTVLLTADGKQIAFGSKGIVKSLHLIISLLRPAPWKPPLKVKLVVRQLGGQRQWPVLEPIIGQGDLREDNPTPKRK